jgi:parvulin-like peptidyl-prolyl isomerase
VAIDKTTAAKRAERLLLAGALLGLFIAVVTATPSDRKRLSNDGAIAKVNQQHIDRTEFAGAYQALLSDKNKAPTAADKKLVLDRLIEEELLVQRGLEIGLLEGDAAVRKAVAMAVIEFVLAQKGSDALSEANLRRFYNENKARFTPANRLQVSRIFVPYMEPRQSPEMTEKLDEIRTALRGGMAFSKARETFGTEILPPLPRVMLTPPKMTDYLGPELTQSASRLPQGSISDALAGPTGWHFLKIIRNQPGKPPAFETIRLQIVDAVRHQRDDKTLREYLDWLRARADIVLAPDAPKSEAGARE